MTGRFAVHAFPPDVAVVGQGAVGEDDVLLEGVHGRRVGCVGGAGGDAEEAVFGIDGIGSAVRAYLDPGDVVADALAPPSGDGGREHGEIGLAAGRREGGRNVVLFARGVNQAQDQHVLGHPTLAFRHGRGDAQRQAFLPEQGVAAVAAPV